MKWHVLIIGIASILNFLALRILGDLRLKDKENDHASEKNKHMHTKRVIIRPKR